jgi:hypothetical protein
MRGMRECARGSGWANKPRFAQERRSGRNGPAARRATAAYIDAAPVPLPAKEDAMLKLLAVLAAVTALSACARLDGGANGSSPTYEHVCQTGGRGCG